MVKIEIVENDKIFSPKEIKLKKPSSGEILRARKLAKNEEEKIPFALLSIIGIFDGKKALMEDLMNLDIDIMGELVKSLESITKDLKI